MREICSRCYGEKPIRYSRQNCRKYSGSGIILLTENLFLTVPNKCASTLMYDWAHEILNFTELLKDPMYTNLYSERAEVVAYAKKYSQKFCEKREGDIPTRVLFVRHPLLRLISAWNDKFNINNLDNMNGAVFGTKHFIAKSDYFEPEWKIIRQLFTETSQEECSRVIRNPEIDDQSLKRCLKEISVDERFEENPYLVSFERLVNYLLFMQQQAQKYKINDHFTPIDQSEFSGFENGCML